LRSVAEANGKDIHSIVGEVIDLYRKIKKQPGSIGGGLSWLRTVYWNNGRALKKHHFKKHINIILYRTYADLKADISTGFFGVLWWVAEPVIYLAVFYFVFTVLRLRGDENFVVFLLVGLVPWKWFAATVGQGSNSIVKMSALIQQIYLPKYIFPSIVVLQNFFRFLFILAILLVFLMVYGSGISEAWIALPAVVVVQLLFCLGIVSLLAAVIPFFPDLQLLVGNVLTLMFFMSGIIFNISHVPAEFQPYVYLNPMVGIIENYRLILIDGLYPDWIMLGNLLLVSCLLIAGGFYTMTRYDKIYPKIIAR